MKNEPKKGKGIKERERSRDGRKEEGELMDKESRKERRKK